MSKKIVIAAVAALLISHQSTSAQSIKDWFNKNVQSSQKSGSSNSGSLSNNEIVSGLKEALNIGANNAGSKLSATNGYFGNQLLKIVLPPEAQKVESALRSVGMGSLVDKAILSMNRAAEDAAKQAAPIFIKAITSMSITDGLSILTGGQNAATNYLKGATTTALTDAFRPVIQKSLGKTGATSYWSQVFNTYNKLPLNQQKVNPDLTGYVTERALEGLFKTIAEEEAQIRTNPARQVTNLLQKVFGSK